MSRHSAICAGIMIGSAFLAAFSQILLKCSTRDHHKKAIFQFLNWKVAIAYSIFALTLFLNIYAYSGIPFKYGSVLNASSYFFAMILSALILKDRPSWRTVTGNILILTGIAVYAARLF